MPILWTHLVTNFLKSPGLKLWTCKLKLINDIKIKMLWNITATKISLATYINCFAILFRSCSFLCIEQPIKLLQNASTGSMEIEKIPAFSFELFLYKVYQFLFWKAAEMSIFQDEVCLRCMALNSILWGSLTEYFK